MSEPSTEEVAALIGRAEAARDRADWDAAERLYGKALQCDATLYGHSVQRGHALRELGRHAESEAAYRYATEGEPFVADAFLHLGHALKKLSRDAEALDCFARTLALDPRSESARIELVNSGNRDRLPREMFGRTHWRDEIAYALLNSHETAESVRSWVGVLAYPRDAWDTFRNTFPIRPPRPYQTFADDVLILVDARAARPSQLRATILSLQDLTHQSWRCWILTDDRLSQHPVASFAFIDDRVAITGPDLVAQAEFGGVGRTMLIQAGGILHPLALDWMLHAANTTDAVAVFCDEDTGIVRRIAGVYHTAPRLHGVFDIDALHGEGALPSCVLLNAASCGDLQDGYQANVDFLQLQRALLLRAASRGTVVHVPRVLHTTLVAEADAVARDGRGPTDRGAVIGSSLEPACGPSGAEVAPTAQEAGVVTVVIPTRDQAEMLGKCVASLVALARDPSRLDIVVVDNRSLDDATHDLFRDLVARKIARVVPMDEPFNWSRANNLAVSVSNGEYLLFLNNDMEMLTQDWDDRLRSQLARDEIGVVGAKLLYPDLTVQHGGVLLGVDRQGPVHEGVSAPRVDPGPLGRWTSTRAAAAVTGAFLGVRRAVFANLHGFDARNFFLVYNDIDFCFRVREAGLKVLFDARIEMVHHESKTRGQTVGRDSIDWDAAELATLHRRWGAVVEQDPSYNPHWSVWSVPFDGYREPTDSEINRHLMLQADGNPWRVARSGA